MTGDAIIPSDLLEPPDGPFPQPPVQTAEQLLPFGGLSPENFERLCLRLARLEGNPMGCRRYGVPGQKQYGIDIYSRLPGGRYGTYQCKRYEALTPSDIVHAIDEFLTGKWAKRSERFVFCTSCSADRTQVEEVIEEQTDRLLKASVAFEVWDAESLSERLRTYEDIVALFFGPEWTRRFFGRPDLPAPSTAELSEIVRDAVAKGRAPRVVSHDWAPASLRPRLDELREGDPERYSQLAEHLESPPMPALVAAMITTPPAWLKDDDLATWGLLARVAQAIGEWDGAARAWNRIGDARQGSAAASAYTKAATAAAEARDPAEEARLLEAAREADPNNPRLALASWDDGRPLDEQLKQLKQLRSDDPEEQGLITAQLAVVQMLCEDLEGARKSIAAVREALPGSLLTDGLEVSLAVQEGRLAVLAHRAADRVALAAADEKAAVTRKKLIAQRRYSESTRMLMLGSDIQATLEDRGAASKMLRGALPEERETQEQKEVLAWAAAGRAIDHQLALEFLEGAKDTPTVLHLLFVCLEDVGTPAQRQEALDGLDRIVTEGGPRAAEAAFERLAACLGSTPTPWSDEAAVLLRAQGHERAAVSAEAQDLVNREGWAPVEKLLRPYGQTPWALAAALRASLHQRVDRAESLKAAKALLAIGPAPRLRVEAGRGLARGRDAEGARNVLIAVARDTNAPDVVRGDSYELLMKILANDLEDWTTAGVVYTEWVTLRPADVRAHKWAPSVANRGRTARDH